MAGRFKYSRNALAAALAKEIPATNKDWGIRIEPLQQFASNDAKRPLLIFQGTVAMVLLIAWLMLTGRFLSKK